ncbi:DUF3389 family protein [Shewanella cyperi]|uniref:DUF3389 family protein n=1 Tax=Shewanella cyperi TaxID=2814292 RepID=A0A974XK04_9GAMM|nr:DUF3389 family protein [Shewanella cyperi]QSX28673.1 DUF3389 family protein [Shewanella cyperi]QSX39416.1 DUF3389 family protein [Shewanella cyperi]
MVIPVPGGKLIITPHEVQARLAEGAVALSALVEDVRLLDKAGLIIADAGAVRWQLKLSAEQLQEIREFLGLPETE